MIRKQNIFFFVLEGILKWQYGFFSIFDILFRTVRNFNYLTWKMKAPEGKTGPKTLKKRVRGPFIRVFFSGLDPTKKVVEHFLIDILCCLIILNKISKIEEEKTYCHFKYQISKTRNTSDILLVGDNRLLILWFCF